MCQNHQKYATIWQIISVMTTQVVGGDVVTTLHLYTIFQFLDLCVVSSSGGNVVVVSAFMSVKCRNYYCKIVVIWIIKQAE